MHRIWWLILFTCYPLLVHSYDRKTWKHWIDADGDCQNTRAEILIAYSLIPVEFKSDRQCRVVSGRWALLYDGGIVTNVSKIDVDHIIPLKWMDTHGGANWSAGKKLEFANDADNLLPVSASANRRKGAKGIDEWLPHHYRCEYAQHWNMLGLKYNIDYSNKAMHTISVLIDEYC
ncbi:MAG: HNH endonuclease family protein [Alphaproteobacteria bacterium]|nr:HNH endonuclease family protein [Alphaproteobacteria bacterium]